MDHLANMKRHVYTAHEKHFDEITIVETPPKEKSIKIHLSNPCINLVNDDTDYHT